MVFFFNIKLTKDLRIPKKVKLREPLRSLNQPKTKSNYEKYYFTLSI